MSNEWVDYIKRDPITRLLNDANLAQVLQHQLREREHVAVVEHDILTIDAAEAFRLGLVTKVVPLEESDSYVEELVREIADLAPLSHRVHKQILRQVVDNPSSAELTAEEATLPFVNFDSEDFQEGRRAFLERRKPRFSGH